MPGPARPLRSRFEGHRVDHPVGGGSESTGESAGATAGRHRTLAPPSRIRRHRQRRSPRWRPRTGRRPSTSSSTSPRAPADVEPAFLTDDIGDWEKEFKLQAWWLDRMATTTTPLQEKLTLFWHGHFATANYKVDDARLMYLQNALFRSMATATSATSCSRCRSSPRCSSGSTTTRTRRATRTRTSPAS